MTNVVLVEQIWVILLSIQWQYKFTAKGITMATTHDADATIQFRMNSTVKDGAFAVLREMGISPSEALRVFMTQVYKTRTLPLVIAADDDGAGQPPDAGYADWLRKRLQKTIHALDKGEMASYSNETAKAVLHARLEARRSKLKLPD